MLYYTMLYYTIVYYAILYYTIVYYIILYYAILYYTILYRGSQTPPGTPAWRSFRPGCQLPWLVLCRALRALDRRVYTFWSGDSAHWDPAHAALVKGWLARWKKTTFWSGVEKALPDGLGPEGLPAGDRSRRGRRPHPGDGAGPAGETA